MIIIDGKKIAAEIIAELKKKPKPEKFLAAVFIGNNPVSENFLKQKEKVAKELGIDFRLYKFDGELLNDELRAEVRKIAEHKTCGGVIVQLPFPEHVNKHYVMNVIPREKDVDVIGERALGAFYVGRNPVLPPAVGVAEKILSTSNFELRTANVAVVGLGFLIGKPIATWLMGKVKDLILLDKFSDLSAVKNADIVISGVGKAGLIKPEMLKDGAGVIDFGYSIKGDQRPETRDPEWKTKIYGDFDASSLVAGRWSLNKFYTPTPGGTGPILVAKLFENFYALNG